MEYIYRVPAWCRPFEELHDQQLDHFWRPPGNDKFTTDRSDWDQLPYSIKRKLKFIVHVLTAMEPEIIDNADDISTLCKKVLPPHILKDLSIMFIMIDAQKAMEGIHIRSYGTIDSVLSLDMTESDTVLFNRFISMKVESVSRWRCTSIDRVSLSKAILGNVFSEGLIFNNLFSGFSVPKKNGILLTVCTTNDEVQVDENIHSRSYIKMYTILTNKDDGTGNPCIPRINEKEVHDMARDFVQIDMNSIDILFNEMSIEEKSFFLNMNASNSKLYTQIVANCVLESLGYNKLYPVSVEDNPYSFVKQSLIHTLGYIFDRDITEYGQEIDHQYESDSDLDE